MDSFTLTGLHYTLFTEIEHSDFWQIVQKLSAFYFKNRSLGTPKLFFS